MSKPAASSPLRTLIAPPAARTPADGADVVDHLFEIPLPGRILAAPTQNLARRMGPAALPSFVAGPENRIVAYTVSRFIEVTGERKEADLHPPVLALFGPSGVGKTHLAHGIVRHWQREFGDEAAHYTTAADFRRAFLDAIGTNEIGQFRAQFRERRLLAVDDLHRLPADEHLMQELRETLDAIEDRDGTVIITSHRPIATLSNLSPDVRSRLASGLTLKLAPPAGAARMRIIRNASNAVGRDLSTEAANHLADGPSGTAPQLFGALFDFWAAPNGADAMPKRPQPTLSQTIAEVARYTGVSQKHLKSASRRQTIVAARGIAIYLARLLGGASFEQLGRALGGRDHSTVMYNFKKIDRERSRNLALQETLDDLTRILLNH
jgi:chromosomal replication initiator protein